MLQKKQNICNASWSDYGYMKVQIETQTEVEKWEWKNKDPAHSMDVIGPCHGDRGSADLCMLTQREASAF